MTLKQRKLENTPSTTTPVTSANKALIDAETVSIPANGSQNLTPNGHEVVAAAASIFNIDRWAALASNDKMAWDFIGYYTGNGTGGAFGATRVLYYGTSTTTATNGNGTAPWKARFPASGNMAWQDSANGTIPLISGAHAPLPNTKYRYSVVADRKPIVNAATGSITIKAYSLTGTLLATWAKTAAGDGTGGANLGADPLYGIEVDAPTEIGTTGIARLQMDDGRTTEIGAWVDAANVAPTASYPAARTSAAAGAATSLTLTGTDTDGTIASYLHRIVYTSAPATLANATSQTATVTAPTTPGSITVIGGKVTDNSGAVSAEVTEEVCVPTADPTVYPLPNATGGFTRAGSQSSDGATVTTASLLDYLETPADLSSTPQTERIRIPPLVDRSGTLGVTVTAARTGTSGHLTVELFEGTISRGQLLNVPLTDTPTDYPLTLTAPQVDAITDPGGWLQLFVEITFTI